MYESPGKVVAEFGEKHKVVEEHAGDREYSLWGPDLEGRYCRMGRYSDTGSAFRAARVISGCEARAPSFS
jgi:hypothetical protein